MVDVGCQGCDHGSRVVGMDGTRRVLQKIWLTSMAATVVASTAAFALTPDSVSFLRSCPWSAATVVSVGNNDQTKHISIRAGIHAVLYESDIDEKSGAVAPKEHGVIGYNTQRCRAYLDQTTCRACADAAANTTMGVWAALAFLWMSLVPQYLFTFESPTQARKAAITTLSLCGVSTMLYTLHRFHIHCHSAMG